MYEISWYKSVYTLCLNTYLHRHYQYTLLHYPYNHRLTQTQTHFSTYIRMHFFGHVYWCAVIAGLFVFVPFPVQTEVEYRCGGARVPYFAYNVSVCVCRCFLLLYIVRITRLCWDISLT